MAFPKRAIIFMCSRGFRRLCTSSQHLVDVIHIMVLGQNDLHHPALTLSNRRSLNTKQTKTYAEDRDKRELLEAERQLVGRKFDALDEEGAGTIEIEQASEVV